MTTALKSLSPMESLPDEILEIIFMQCSAMDLVVSFQNVSTQWRRVSRAPGIWKNIVFSDYNKSDKSVIEILGMSPGIQTVSFTRNHHGKVLQTLTKCPNLRKVFFCSFQRVSVQFLKALQANCPKIEYLYLPISVITVPMLCEAMGKFANLKTLELGRIRMRWESDDDPINLKPIAINCPNLKSINFWDDNFQLVELQQFLTMKKDTLESLGVACSNVDKECVLPLLSDLPVLRSLHLYCFDRCEQQTKGKNLANLKNVTNLTLEEGLARNVDKIVELFRSKSMAHLKHISLRGFDEFNNTLKDVITQNCPLLKGVDIHGL